ncbi:RING-type E3 ubiquitin transferase [Malassezia psittaci]|uniref:Pre-mRNA-processing factor 19 n=1 Tax=Malassezia psittaci TaxID=1821823 RepID=A0AAF0F8Q9_9BASI|nr:RING-type E3 ubiquitin transferase [Malassezia psittaci]
MFCAISGEAPKEPVLSKKSGLLFEKRLIERYIDENGKDPITGEELSLDDLIAVKSSPHTAFPRPPSHTSIPSLLVSLQNEYDAMVFESLALKKQYDSVRQDLAHALYTNDASTRVIARLLKERNEARDALANVHASLGMSSQQDQDVDMATDDEPSTALPASIVSAMDETAASLSSERRSRMKQGAPEGYTTSASAPSLQEDTSITSLHAAGSPGISALDVSANGKLVLTGGKDKAVLVLDFATQKVLSTFKGHTKPVNAVVFAARANPTLGSEAADLPAPPYAASASADKSVRVYSAKDNNTYGLAHTLKGYKDEVTGVDVHPTDLLVGSASRDRSWALHALSSGEQLMHVTAPVEDDDQGDFVYESFAFHPDGQLAATGTAQGAIRIWDVKQGKQSAVFTGHNGPVHTLSFSPNGYLLAAASRNSNEVKIWDLRKLDVARTVELPEGQKVSRVRFDPTAQLLAVVGDDVRVFAGKQLNLVYTYQENSAEETSAQWSPVDGALFVAGMDRTLRVFGAHA